MELLKEIKNRVSIESFSKKSIKKEILNRILEAGRRAPSAKNRQPWRFIIIDKEDTKNKICKACFEQNCVEEAPVIIAVCTTNTDYKMPNGQLSYPIDLSLAASFMTLQAEHEELGSHIITTFDESDIKHLLTVPYSMKIVMLLLLGHPKEKPISPERKPIKSITSYNHW